MSAATFMARANLRRRWRRVVMLVLLVGAAGGFAVGLAIGANRTSTALDRFEEATDSADVELLVLARPSVDQLAALRSTPGVAAVGELRAFGTLPVDAPDFTAMAAAIDDQFGQTVDRSRLVAGRRTDPDEALEVTVNELLAERLALEPGDHLAVNTWSPDQVATIVSGGDPGAFAGPRLTMRVSGIERRPLDLGIRGSSGGLMVMTPAFAREYTDTVGAFGERIRVRMAEGYELAPVLVASREVFGDETLAAQGVAFETEGARDAARVLAVATWVLTGVAALAGAVTIALVLGRETALASEGSSVLRAMGMRRRDRVVAMVPFALVVAVGGTALAATVATAISPLLPLGVAGRADPITGVAMVPEVLAIGSALVALIVVLVVIATALRDSGARRTDQVSTTVENRSAAGRLAQLGMPPAMFAGIRIGTGREPGERRAAVSAAVGVAFGVTGIVALLVVTASMDGVLGDPATYGTTWDVQARDITPSTPCGGDDFGMTEIPGLENVAEICRENIELSGRPVTGAGVIQLRGSVSPVALDGRLPESNDEVALGGTTLARLGVSIGDTVDARRSAGGISTYEVVGRVLVPSPSDEELTDGAVFTGDGFAPIAAHQNFQRYFVAELEPGASHDEVAARIDEVPQLAGLVDAPVPVEVARVDEALSYSSILVVVLIVTSLVAVGHALVTGVRRRRRELAVLRAIGFDRRQVRSLVAWVAVGYTVAGMIVGIPAGLVVGRVTWQLITDGVGIEAASVIPALWVVAVVAGALMAAVAVATVLAARPASGVPAADLREA
ncbi:MAG TPA: ABC transporter permease [Microthrixaceae bacterium]|nr:ABC transporter permease [Microthrixaceae bacterium]